MHVLLLSASLYVLLNWFNVDRAFFLPAEAGCAFIIVAALHCLIRKQHVFYLFHDS